MDKSNIVSDVDGVLINFIQGIIDYGKKLGIKGLPESYEEVTKYWFFTYKDEVWIKAKNDPEFWANLQPLNNANEKMNFIPAMYLTARPCPSEITRESLLRLGFPEAPVKTVHTPLDKVLVMEEHPDWILVDDHVETVEKVLAIDRSAVLYSALHQQEHKTDHLPIIHTIEEMNLLAGAMKYREYRRQLNVESQTEKGDVGSEESGLA